MLRIVNVPVGIPKSGTRYARLQFFRFASPVCMTLPPNGSASMTPSGSRPSLRRGAQRTGSPSRPREQTGASF